MKPCSKCGATKPADGFFRKDAKRLMSACKVCYREGTERYRKANPERDAGYSRRRYQADPQAAREAVRPWRAENPDRAKAIERRAEAKRKPKKKLYREANREAIRARNAEYRAANADRIRAYNAAYRADRRELLRERHRLWREANPEAAKAITARWKRANKAKVNAATHRRRTTLQGCSEHHTAAEWEALLAATGHTCLWCGANDVAMTKDHIVPVSKGGSNAVTNLQPLCKSCNSRKHTKTMDLRGP